MLYTEKVWYNGFKKSICCSLKERDRYINFFHFIKKMLEGDATPLKNSKVNRARVNVNSLSQNLKVLRDT